MKWTAQEIAQIVQGEVQGDPGLIITGIAGLEDAAASDLTYVGDERYVKDLVHSKAGAVLVKAGVAIQTKTAILVKNPQAAFLMILNLAAKEKEDPARGIHPTAVISQSAKIGANVYVGPHAVIEGEAEIGDGSWIGPQCFIGRKTKLGKNCKIYPQVIIREEIVIHSNVIIHSGSVIGADGFGYATVDKVHHKIPQIGIVEIEDHVEIGANTTIDRATLGKTIIGAGTKIDNHVQIAHNVKIGKGCIIVAHAGIAGSSTLGNFVTIAGQVGVGDHVKIGDGTMVAAQSGIHADAAPGSVLFGTPARPIREERKIQAIISRLPDIYDDFKKMKKNILKEGGQGIKS